MLNNSVDAPTRARDRETPTTAQSSTHGPTRAHDLAKLLHTVAHASNVTSGHELAAADGRWRLTVRPDGSVDVIAADGCALLRGRLAAPEAVAALLAANAAI